MESAEDLVRKFNEELSDIDWKALQPHFAIGTLVVADQTMDLVEVGVKMAQDDKQAFLEWLATGKVYKPDEDQARRWDKNNSRFNFLIVQPFVLAQVIA